MVTVIADTNVLSELMRVAPDPRVVAWVRAQAHTTLFTTAVTFAEIRYGLARLPEGRRRTQLVDAAEEVFVTFGEQVLPFDVDAADEFGNLVRRREVAGFPMETADAQIAAIALARGAVVATRNVRDFDGTGVELVDPWDGPSTRGGVPSPRPR